MFFNVDVILKDIIAGFSLCLGMIANKIILLAIMPRYKLNQREQEF